MKKISAVIEKQMCGVYALGVFRCCIHEELSIFINYHNERHCLLISSYLVN